jgi:hypothetical protein
MTYLDPAVNPYDPSVQDYDAQTLPLDEIIRRGVTGMLLSLRVCLPAIVTQVHGNQKVDVQPALQVRYIDQNQGTNMPPVQNVPVSMPMGANYSIKLPVAVGDTGYLIFADRSLDAWLAGSGAIVDPQDSRQHDLSDAIFIPGMVPFSKQTTDSTTDLVLTNGQSQIRIEASGKFQIKNSQNELIDLMDQLLTILQTDTFTNTLIGPQPFIDYTQQLLQQLQTKLETLKGP